MNFIKKIFEGKIDEEVHQQFQKFSKGLYKDRALIRAKSSKKGYAISTTCEFANELVKTMAEKLGSNKAKTSGCVVSTSDLTGILDFQDKKQFMGIKQYIINRDMSGEEILSLLNRLPKAFFALSFNAGGSELKIKPKAPKSAKPGSKGGEKPKIDFCKIKTDDKNIAESFIFEMPNWKEAEICHDFMIDELVIPEELKKEKDFAKIREAAKRKGKIIRTSVIDGKEIRKEVEFEA